MAPKYKIKTDVYQELWDILATARKSELPSGGKRMMDEMRFSCMKEIVDWDLKLDAVRFDAARLHQRVSAMESFTAMNTSQLGQLGIELVEIEIALQVNRAKEAGDIAHARALKQMLVANYIE